MGYLAAGLALLIAWKAWSRWAGPYEQQPEHASYPVDLGGVLWGWSTQPRPQLRILVGSKNED